jgi:mRNA interferase MazF
VVEVPARGTFIWLNFEPQSGREQMGRKPALVVSHTAFNRKRGFAFVCPIGNTQRKNPFYVVIPEGLTVTGVVMCDQLRSLDYRIRNAEFLGECPISLLEEVLLRIQPIFL